ALAADRRQVVEGRLHLEGGGVVRQRGRGRAVADRVGEGQREGARGAGDGDALHLVEAVLQVEQLEPGLAAVLGLPDAAAGRGEVDDVVVDRVDRDAGDAARDRLVAGGLAAVDRRRAFGVPAGRRGGGRRGPLALEDERLAG